MHGIMNMDAGCNLAVLKPDGYFAHVRAEMMEFLPPDAATVLDVGCGEGVFGAQVKQRLHAEVWGVELDRTAAASARHRIDTVLCGDFAVLIDQLPDHYFDCVIFNDVLEHLADPFAILAIMKNKITPQGVVVCSIPNVRYFYTLKMLLLDKQWKYEEHGVLDKSHLRFFTRDSIRDMFHSLGYEILTLEGINSRISWKFHLLNLLSLGNLADSRFIQFACVARPSQ